MENGYAKPNITYLSVVAELMTRVMSRSSPGLTCVVKRLLVILGSDSWKDIAVSTWAQPSTVWLVLS